MLWWVLLLLVMTLFARVVFLVLVCVTTLLLGENDWQGWFAVIASRIPISSILDIDNDKLLFLLLLKRGNISILVL